MHIHLPTPLNEVVLWPTLALFLLVLIFGLPLWIVLIPVVLDVAVIALAIGTAMVAVRVLNYRARRRIRQYLR